MSIVTDSWSLGAAWKKRWYHHSETEDEVLLLRAALGACPTPIAFLSEAGDLQGFNGAFAALCDSKVEVGHSVLDLFSERDRELIRHVLGSVRDQDQAGVVVRLSPPRYPSREMLFLAATIPPREEIPIGVVLTAQDRSAFAKEASDLAQGLTSVAARNANAAVSLVTASLTHDVRNMLAVATAALEALARPEREPCVLGEPGIRRLLENASKALEEANDLLRHVRQTSSDSAAREGGETSVAEAFSAVARLLRHRVDGESIRISAHADPKLRVALPRPTMIQILANLMENGIHALHTKGEGELVARATVTEDDALVRVTICDTGVGIPPDMMLRVFDPYQALLT